MSIVYLIVILAVFAACFWLVWKFLPAPWKNPGLIVIAILLVLWLLMNVIGLERI